MIRNRRDAILRLAVSYTVEDMEVIVEYGPYPGLLPQQLVRPRGLGREFRLFLEQIRVCSRPDEIENVDFTLIFLIVNQQPIRLDMTFSKAGEDDGPHKACTAFR